MAGRVIPQVFPKPASFHQRAEFDGARADPVPADIQENPLLLAGADARFTGRVASQLKLLKFRRSGVLRGQYVILHGGFIAIDRDGAPIKLNADSDDDWANRSIFSQLENFCDSESFVMQRDWALHHWDSLPVLPSMPVLAETYASSNYYHFTIRFMPRVRHFDDQEGSVIGVPLAHLQHRFQRDFIMRCYHRRRVRPLPDMAKVADPVLMYEPFTAQALGWLRRQSGLHARRGARRIFVTRRCSLVGRHHGGIRPDEAFEALLRGYGFESVDFGAGEIPVAEQVALLDGAGLVMSAHGANLTNIAFVESGTAVVELLPYYWCYFSHMQIALAAGLRYFGVVCQHVNENREMVPDLGLLSDTLDRALRG